MVTPINIIIDTREQLPYTFNRIEPKPDIIFKKLDSGDYSLAGFENRIAIERKTIPDLCRSVGIERQRFEREMIRLKEYQYASIIIEGTFQELFTTPQQSKINPRSVYRTMLAWSIKYDIHIHWCDTRQIAEKTTFLLLNFFNKYNS